MLVSICLPTYNGGAFVEQAINSVIAQTYTDIELIIVDDCSSDDTVELIESMITKGDSRIKLYRNDVRLGLFANYNRSLSIAKGGLIKPMAQDDILHRHAVERMAGVLAEDQGLVLVSCAKGAPTYAVNPEDQAETLVPGRHSGPTVTEACLRTYRNLIGEPVTVMFRANRENPDSARFCFDVQYYSLGDLDFWLRLLELGDMYYLPETLITFREHGGSATASLLRSFDWVLDFFRLGHQYEHHLKRIGISKEQFFMGFIDSAGGLVDHMLERGKLSVDELEGFKEVAFYSMRRSAQLATKSRAYDAVINSTSWRVTEPLRAIMTQLGRGKY